MKLILDKHIIEGNVDDLRRLFGFTAQERLQILKKIEERGDR